MSLCYIVISEVFMALFSDKVENLIRAGYVHLDGVFAKIDIDEEWKLAHSDGNNVTTLYNAIIAVQLPNGKTIGLRQSMHYWYNCNSGIDPDDEKNEFKFIDGEGPKVGDYVTAYVDRRDINNYYIDLSSWKKRK